LAAKLLIPCVLTAWTVSERGGTRRGKKREIRQ
jgi:hypothetical protein